MLSRKSIETFKRETEFQKDPSCFLKCSKSTEKLYNSLNEENAKKSPEGTIGLEGSWHPICLKMGNKILLQTKTLELATLIIL